MAKTVLLTGASGRWVIKRARRCEQRAFRASPRANAARGRASRRFDLGQGDGFDLDSLHAACRASTAWCPAWGHSGDAAAGRAGYRDVDVPIHRNPLAAMRQAAVPALVYVSAHHDAELAPLSHFAAHRLVEELALATPGLVGDGAAAHRLVFSLCGFCRWSDWAPCRFLETAPQRATPSPMPMSPRCWCAPSTGELAGSSRPGARDPVTRRAIVLRPCCRRSPTAPAARPPSWIWLALRRPPAAPAALRAWSSSRWRSCCTTAWHPRM